VKEIVYITGGSGLLALSWATAMRDRYQVVLGLHRRSLSVARIETRPANLDTVDELVGDLEAIQPRLVVHTAGLTNVEACEKNPTLAQRVNVGLAANVAQACGRLGVSMVHISTDHVFSGDVPLMNETQPTAPLNAYARSKAEAEVCVLAAHPAALVIRTNFYCWGPSYRSSFSDSIIAALRAGRPTILFEDVFYTPILAETLANAAHDLVDRRAEGIFHVAGDDRISKCEFGLMLAKDFALDSRLIRPGLLADQPALVRRPRDMSLSNAKTCNLLGRKLGGVHQHLGRLREQERQGFAREMQNL
jgi:dTDP-4-dehydrorhamnose reductase